MSEITSNTKEESKGRRVTIDLTSAAAAEVDRLRTLTELSTADIFRHGLSLFRIIVDAKARGHEMMLVNPKEPGDKTRIELPITVLQAQR